MFLGLATIAAALLSRSLDKPVMLDDWTRFDLSVVDSASCCVCHTCSNGVVLCPKGGSGVWCCNLPIGSTCCAFYSCALKEATYHVCCTGSQACTLHVTDLGGAYATCE